jgi:hypothetical protein
MRAWTLIELFRLTRADLFGLYREIVNALAALPEEPTQHFEALALVFTAKSAIPLGQARQDRWRLREAQPRFLENWNLAHLVDLLAPFGGPPDPAVEIGSNPFKFLPVNRQHKPKLVAVSGFWNVVQSISGHRRYLATVEFNRSVPARGLCRL